MQNNSEKLAWTGKSHGGYWGNLCFALLLKIGMFPAYALLIFVSAFFVLFRRKACEGGADYLRRMGLGDGFCERYKLVYSFGMSILDRVAFFARSGKIKCQNECRRSVEAAISGGRGLIVITAHVGGWQIAGAHLAQYGRKVSILGMDGEDEKIAKLLERERELPKLDIIGDPSDPMGILPAYSALKRGEIVAMHGDRFAGGRGAEVDFLGARATFPTSSYILAAKANVEILQVMCVRERLFRYRMYSYPPLRLENLRADALDCAAKSCAQTFAENLSHTLKDRPYQWYNFYKFWGE